MRKARAIFGLCHCGCGQKTSVHRGKYRKFVNGHNSRNMSQDKRDKISKSLLGNTPWNKGLTKDEDERIAQYGQSVSKYQREHYREPWNKGLTKETSEKVAQYAAKIVPANKGKKATGKQLEGLSKGWRWAKGLTKETDERIKSRSLKARKSLKKYFDSLPVNEFGIRNVKHSEFLKKYYVEHPEKHPNRIVCFKERKTGIEEIMGRHLKQNSIDAIHNYRVKRFSIDWAIVEKKIGIECDGEFWHKDKERDLNRDKFLLSLGWVILRFSEYQIKNDIQSCLTKIKEVIRQDDYSRRRTRAFQCKTEQIYRAE